MKSWLLKQKLKVVLVTVVVAVVVAIVVSFQCGIRGLLQVVDVGSGRGYLGCHLSLMYHIPVVGIDSSPSNTGSAAERTRLLRTQWRGLVSEFDTLCTTVQLLLCNICMSLPYRWACPS